MVVLQIQWQFENVCREQDEAKGELEDAGISKSDALNGNLTHNNKNGQNTSEHNDEGNDTIMRDSTAADDNNWVHLGSPQDPITNKMVKLMGDDFKTFANHLSCFLKGPEQVGTTTAAHCCSPLRYVCPSLYHCPSTQALQLC